MKQLRKSLALSSMIFLLGIPNLSLGDSIPKGTFSFYAAPQLYSFKLMNNPLGVSGGDFWRTNLRYSLGVDYSSAKFSVLASFSTPLLPGRGEHGKLENRDIIIETSYNLLSREKHSNHFFGPSVHFGTTTGYVSTQVNNPIFGLGLRYSGQRKGSAAGFVSFKYGWWNNDLTRNSTTINYQYQYYVASIGLLIGRNRR